jgi:hypothetical protein
MFRVNLLQSHAYLIDCWYNRKKNTEAEWHVICLTNEKSKATFTIPWTQWFLSLILFEYFVDYMCHMCPRQWKPCTIHTSQGKSFWKCDKQPCMTRRRKLLKLNTPHARGEPSQDKHWRWAALGRPNCPQDLVCNKVDVNKEQETKQARRENSNMKWYSKLICLIVFCQSNVNLYIFIEWMVFHKIDQSPNQFRLLHWTLLHMQWWGQTEFLVVCSQNSAVFLERTNKRVVSAPGRQKPV